MIQILIIFIDLKLVKINNLRRNKCVFLFILFIIIILIMGAKEIISREIILCMRKQKRVKGRSTILVKEQVKS